MEPLKVLRHLTGLTEVEEVHSCVESTQCVSKPHKTDKSMGSLAATKASNQAGF